VGSKVQIFPGPHLSATLAARWGDSVRDWAIGAGTDPANLTTE
jgi:hypothetical protein